MQLALQDSSGTLYCVSIESTRLSHSTLRATRHILLATFQDFQCRAGQFQTHPIPRYSVFEGDPDYRRYRCPRHTGSERQETYLDRSRDYFTYQIVCSSCSERQVFCQGADRNPESARAKELVPLGNVTLFQGQQDNTEDLRKAFRGVYGAWVNLDGFTLGENNEIFYGIRAYEIARAVGLQHFIWASTEYTLKNGDWNENYHYGHMSAKGRVGEFTLSQRQEGMTTSLFTTGPYVDSLHGG